MATADAAARGAGEALLGEILIDAGQPAEAVRILEAAAASIPKSGSDAVRATILANLSRALMRTNEPTRSIAAADLALDLAEHLGLEGLIADTFNNKGSSLNQLGRQREGIALLRAAIELAHAGGFVAAETRAINNLGGSLDDFREAREQFRASEELGSRVGNRSGAAWARESRRFMEFVAATAWDSTVAEIDDPTVDAGGPLDEARRLYTLASIQIARGQSSDAAIRRLEELAAQMSDAFAWGSLHGILADRAMLAGDFALAADEGLLAASTDAQFSMLLLNDVLRATVWAGDLARATEVHRRIGADPSTGTQADAYRAAGRAGIAALEGRIDDAIGGYRDAIARYRAIGADIWVARAALDLVRLVGGKHPAGQDVAMEARAIFERVGAKRYLDLLDAALAGNGSNMPEPAGSDMAASRALPS